MEKEKMLALFPHITKIGTLIDVSNNIIYYKIHDFKAAFLIKEGLLYFHMKQLITKTPNACMILDMLNESGSYGQHTLDPDLEGTFIYHYSTVFPGNTFNEKSLFNAESLAKISEEIRRAEICAAGGYKLLSQSYFGKSIHYEFWQYRNWINNPEKFPPQLFAV